jgi:hypothetical protein
MGWFLEQRHVFQIGSVALLTLKPEAHLLYLCAHAEIAHGEGQMRLLRYLDLHLLLRHVHSLDWSLIVERAVCFGWTYAVERALTISQHYFATPLPDGLLSELQQRRPAHEDVGNVTRRQATGNRWEITLRRFETMAWTMRLRLALQLAFPPAAYVRWRYRVDRSWKLPFFYLFRWSDVLGEALKTVSKQVWRRGHQDRVHKG